jgi:hypothetical protein
VLIECDTGVRIRYGKRKVDVNEHADVDELQAHKFLEKLGETLTVRELRKRLDALDIDNNHRLALSEYLLAKYTKTPQALISGDQGTGVPAHEMAAAVAQLERLQEQFAQTSEALAAATAAAEAAAEAKKAADAAARQAEADKKEADAAQQAATAAEEQAKARAADAKAAEERSHAKAEAVHAAEKDLKEAEEEARVAVEEVRKEEAAIKAKVDGFNAIINDEGQSGVKRNKAKNELAQLQAEDPLALRKAKITLEAALKRAEKARAPAAAAREAAVEEAKKAAQATEVANAQARAASEAREKATHAAHQAAAAKQKADATAAQAAKDKQASDEAQAALERQLVETERQVQEAEAVLQELRSRKGTPHGKIWWMGREIEEAKKFMPSK